MQFRFDNPLPIAVFLTVIGMGAIGILVVIPIAAINLSWNSLSNVLMVVPPINVWQAALLYVAIVCIVYLTGLVKIEVVHDDEVEQHK